ncbi:hypothetical protein, partial [Burkholderia gladioli]|uniref:hypothetical protein n=1 Tax=Burkholderia gladioli TaxID=28095 RepID=UPI001C6144C1
FLSAPPGHDPALQARSRRSAAAPRHLPGPTAVLPCALQDSEINTLSIQKTFTKRTYTRVQFSKALLHAFHCMTNEGRFDRPQQPDTP